METKERSKVSTCITYWRSSSYITPCNEQSC